MFIFRHFEYDTDIIRPVPPISFHVIFADQQEAPEIEQPRFGINEADRMELCLVPAAFVDILEIPQQTDDTLAPGKWGIS